MVYSGFILFVQFVGNRSIELQHDERGPLVTASRVRHRDCDDLIELVA